MGKFLPVEGHPGYVRDTTSGAILNTNRKAIQEARRQKQLRKEKREQEQLLRQKVDDLENDIKDIKNMLSIIAEKIS